MDVVERFLSQSNLIGNINEFKEKEFFLNIYEDFNYVNLKSLNLFKNSEISQSGIKKAIVEADLAIAETGSIVIDSADEQLRLATCLSDELHVLLPKNRIVDTLEESIPFLENLAKNPNAYIAFITGASRTADIEMVLSIGVHGCAKMYVYLVDL